MMNTKEMTNTTAMTETNNLFKDYKVIESVSNSIKNVIKTGIDNKYCFDKPFMLAVIKYQQQVNGFNRNFINDLEAITNSFKEAVQYVSRTEDLFFQEEYCLLNFNNFEDLKKFTEKYVYEYHNEDYKYICTVFDKIKINDEIVNLIKEMRKRNLISSEDNKNMSIIIDKYNNR